jgi:hypothetical protein
MGFGVLARLGTRLTGVLAVGGNVSNHIDGKGKGQEPKKCEVAAKNCILEQW